jgi:hypothetical protein
MKKPMTLKEHAKLPASKAHGPKAAGFKKGGPTSEDRMRMGRNMSRIANQKTG